ncbi:MAG: histidine kinase [Acidobacteria bacterium]|nr:histidine kinase [Acidobacteriota bacterium]
MKDQMEKLVSELVDGGIFFQDAVAEFEKRFIKRVLDGHHGNQLQSAKALGIHRNTLGRKMEEYNLASKNGSHRSSAKPKHSKKK